MWVLAICKGRFVLQLEQRGSGNRALRVESGVEQSRAVHGGRDLVELVPAGDSSRCSSGQGDGVSWHPTTSARHGHPDSSLPAERGGALVYSPGGALGRRGGGEIQRPLSERFSSAWVVRGERDLRRQSLVFEQRHNTRYRYSKLHWQTPEMPWKQCHARIRFPASRQAPWHPLAKPETGRYHLVPFIRSDGRLDVFGEQDRRPVAYPSGSVASV
jgi:hypothetical protein